MREKKNIGYVIVREDLNNPILYTQVIEMLNKVDSDKFNITIVWFYRVDYIFKQKEIYREFMSKIKESGIRVIRKPILVWKFPQPVGLLNVVAWQGVKTLEKLTREYELDILHARGYYAGLMVSTLKVKNENLKCIFDPRSPYITEMHTTYNIDTSSKLINKWKTLEKTIIDNCDYTIAVSEPFQKYLSSVSGQPNKVNHIPNCVQLLDESEIETQIIKNRRDSICYVGSIGNGWNNTDVYVEAVSNINKKYPHIKYEFYVIENEPGILEKKLIEVGLSPDLFMISRVKASEVPMRISGCIAGLQLMKIEDTRMGIKVVDYLGAGVPIITNKLAKGAADIVDSYKVGLVIDYIVGSNDFCIDDLIENRTIYEKKCLSIANKYFSTNAVAAKYQEIYEE